MSNSPAKTVLIAGAEGALGRALVQRFVMAGHTVYATYMREKPKDGPAAVQWLQADLSSAASVQKILGELPNGAPRVWVHAAGGFRFAKVAECSEADWDFLMSANLKSLWAVSRTVVPRMAQAGFGRVVWVSSRATLAPAGAGMGPYLASKAGVNALVQALTEETKHLDVTVNAVLPTVIDTPANRRDMPSADFSTWVKTDELAEIIFGLTEPAMNPVRGALLAVAGRV